MIRVDTRLAGLAGVLALLALLAVAAVGWQFGSPVAVGGALAVLVGVALLLNARVALALFVAVVALAESEAGAGLVDGSRLYDSILEFAGPVNLLFAGVVIAVAVYAARPGVGLRLPGPFTLPLLVLAVAIVSGAVTGSFGGASVNSLAGPIVTLAPLVILPVLVATVARKPGDGRRMTRAGIALAGARAALGLLAFLFFGAFDPGLGDRSTSYEPTSNWLVMVLILGLVGALVGRVRVPARVLVLLPLAAAALTLSYRRSFWIAAVLGLLVVLVVASGRVGRRLIVPVVAVLGVGIYLALSTGVVGELQGPVAARVQSLDPSKVAANDQDRYRIGERRNVLAEIRDHPLTGAGVGVDWRGRYPVTISYTDQRNYVHMGFLWFWLKLGLLGAVAYLWIFAAALATGLRVFRRHPDRVVGLAGLAVGVGALGLLVAELTASWVGPDPRLTIVFAAALGFLAVVNREAIAPPPPPAPAADPARTEVLVAA